MQIEHTLIAWAFLSCGYTLSSFMNLGTNSTLPLGRYSYFQLKVSSLTENQAVWASEAEDSFTSVATASELISISSVHCQNTQT